MKTPEEYAFNAISDMEKTHNKLAIAAFVISVILVLSVILVIL